MESIFTRYRNVIVLLAILVVQIVGLAVQVRRTDEGRMTVDSKDSSGVRLLRLWAEAVMAPPERLIQGAKIATIDVWQNYVDLRHVHEQNRDLQETIDRLRLEQASLLEDANRASGCRRCWTSSTNTSIRRSRHRPSARAAAISRGSSISTRVRTTA